MAGKAPDINQQRPPIVRNKWLEAQNRLPVVTSASPDEVRIRFSPLYSPPDDNQEEIWTSLEKASANGEQALKGFESQIQLVNKEAISTRLSLLPKLRLPNPRSLARLAGKEKSVCLSVCLSGFLSLLRLYSWCRLIALTNTKSRRVLLLRGRNFLG
eukprot:TRINITY_DN1475_c0_g1_i19.p1 TRINITY_DN1475_c0_g1~~TRINITY_DN1475_c0_g1_i19.p1  ORF type:complete len:157 (-),score=13.52 TRINITY_DN1475_c0_g1_i19:816-1286(-)